MINPHPRLQARRGWPCRWPPLVERPRAWWAHKHELRPPAGPAGLGPGPRHSPVGLPHGAERSAQPGSAVGLGRGIHLCRPRRWPGGGPGTVAALDPARLAQCQAAPGTRALRRHRRSGVALAGTGLPQPPLPGRFQGSALPAPVLVGGHRGRGGPPPFGPPLFAACPWRAVAARRWWVHPRGRVGRLWFRTRGGRLSLGIGRRKVWGSMRTFQRHTPTLRT